MSSVSPPIVHAVETAYTIGGLTEYVRTVAQDLETGDDMY